jgi:hypothetical protein
MKGGGLGEETLVAWQEKKEEFPGTMENMLPGNSFPQICVVSGNEYVENRDGMQVTEGWCL